MADYKTLLLARDRDISNGKVNSEMHLAYAAYKRVHKVSFMLPEDFYVKDSALHGITRRPNAEVINSIEDFTSYMGGKGRAIEEPLPLKEFDTMFFRVAFRNATEMGSMDTALRYLATLKAKHPEIAMVNEPQGIFMAGPKSYEALIYGDIIPRTQVTKDSSRLKTVMDEAKDDGIKLVGKPLDGMGGSSVIPLPWTAHRTYAELLVRPLGSDIPIPAIIQERVEGMDRRLFVLDGELLGGYARLAPEGDFRANETAGGEQRPYALQDVDHEIVRRMKESLVRDGLHFVGIDVMGPEEEGNLENTKLIEVNVRCPSGIINLESRVSEDVSDRIVSFAEDLSRRLISA